MAPYDDYRHEVDRLSTEQVEAILGGRDPGEPVAGRALAVVGEIRRALIEEPPADVAERHLVAMAAAGRGRRTATGRQRNRVSPFRRRRLVVALAAALAVGAGAVAALTLQDRPDEARQPAPDDVRTSGVEETGSPVSGEDPEGGMSQSPRSNHGEEVSDLARGTALLGCEKGQAVSDRASEESDAHRPGHVTERDPCDRSDRVKGGGRRGSGRGAEASAHGKQNSQEAKGGGRAHGQRTAEQPHLPRSPFGRGPASGSLPDSAGP